MAPMAAEAANDSAMIHPVFMPTSCAADLLAAVAMIALPTSVFDIRTP